MIVFVVSDKLGRFRLGLEKTLGVKPFRKFNISVLARVDKAIDVFAEEKLYAKVFCMFWEVVHLRVPSDMKSVIRYEKNLFYMIFFSSFLDVKSRYKLRT